MSGHLVLFDNPSRFGSGTTWSPNVWKTRLLLNYKGIPYKTQWLHGADFGPTFWSYGIPPHQIGTALNPYTIPVVQFQDGHYLMESRRIAHEIERLYPEPRALVDDPVHARAQQAWSKILMTLQAVLVPRMPRECLSGPSIQYHRNARAKTYGMELEEYEARAGGERCWQAGTPHLKLWADILNENKEGPFCLGATPSYADFLIVAFLEWCRVLGGDCLQRVCDVDVAFEKVYVACGPWLERNDH